MIESHVIADMVKLEIFLHSLGKRKICFEAVLTGQTIVKLFSRQERSFVKSLILVDVVVAENFFLLYYLNHFICRV